MDAINNIITTVSPYFPAIISVVAGMAGFRAVLNMIRSVG